MKKNLNSPEIKNLTCIIDDKFINEVEKENTEEVIFSLAVQQISGWFGTKLNKNIILGKFLNFNDAYERYFLISIRDGSVSIAQKPAHLANFALLSRALRYKELIELVLKTFSLDIDLCILYDAEDWNEEDNELPVFTFQKKSGTNKILFPDIDFLMTDYYRPEFIPNDTTSFRQKSCSAIFVGSTTGGQITKKVVENLFLPRIRSYVYFKNNKFVNFTLPKLVQYDNDETKKLLISMGMGDGRIIKMEEQYNNKFMISMDGNGAACSRLIAGLRSNCTVLKYDSQYELYYFNILRPWVHYIPIKNDEDVLNIVQLENENPGMFEYISRYGRNFYERYLNKENIIRYVYFLLNVYEGLFEQPKIKDFQTIFTRRSELIINSVAEGEALQQKGEQYFCDGKFAEAERAFRAALLQDNRDPARHWLLSTALDRQGRKADAADAAEEAARRAPNEARYWEHLGHMRAAAGDSEAAEQAFRRASEIEPERASAIGALSHTLGALGRWPEAIAAARAALVLRAKDSDLHYHHGNLLMRAGEPGAAVDAYRQAIALGRTDKETGRQLAEALRMAEEIAETAAAGHAEVPSPAASGPVVPSLSVPKQSLAAAPTAPQPADAPRFGLLRNISGSRQAFEQ